MPPITLAAVTRRKASAGALSAMLVAAKRPSPLVRRSRGAVTLGVRDLTPRFLDFYQAAQGLDPDQRFAEWKARYDYAAVPPTDQGDTLARSLLDAAWDRYPLAIKAIEGGAAAMRPDPLDSAVAVAHLLEATQPMEIGLVAYVGAFETNAFTVVTEAGPTVSIPVEIDPAVRDRLLIHEMTHAVHMHIAALSAGYERTLGRIVVEEGMAMRAVQALRPGRPTSDYVGEAAWLAAALAHRREIVRAIAPLLDRRDSETVFKFTMGTGATGREREAYVAGWLAVGSLLAQGWTLARLARAPEADLPSIALRGLSGRGGSQVDDEPGRAGLAPPHGRGHGALQIGTKPFSVHRSLPTPWWTKNSPAGSYRALIASRRDALDPQKSPRHSRLKKSLSET